MVLITRLFLQTYIDIGAIILLLAMLWLFYSWIKFIILMIIKGFKKLRNLFY